MKEIPSSGKPRSNQSKDSTTPRDIVFLKKSSHRDEYSISPHLTLHDNLGKETPAPVLKSGSESREKKQPMELETAKDILQKFVNTDEKSITNLQQMNVFGGYTIEEIREAAATLSSDIMKKGIQTPGYEPRVLRKSHAQGELKIDMLTKNNIFITWESKRKRILNNFRLQDLATQERLFTGFQDTRLGKRCFFSDLDMNPTVENFQQMVRYTRWAFANMLRWHEPGVIIMPEDLDKKTINQKSPKALP